MRRIVMAFVALFASSALAQETVGILKRAKTLYEEGDWERAAQAYEASYTATQDESLLYSVGQAYQMMGDYTRAVEAYTRFLSLNPNASSAMEVSALVEELTPLTLKGAKPPKEDKLPPRVRHTFPKTWEAGETIQLAAQIEDPSGIFEPKLYYRRGNSGPFIPGKLTQAEGSTFTGIIAALPEGEVTYFFEAFDMVGNGPTRFGTPSYPHALKVVAGGGGARVIAAVAPGAPPEDAAAAAPEMAGEVLEVAGESRPRGPWAYLTLGAGAAAALAGVYFGYAAWSAATAREAEVDPLAWKAADDEVVAEGQFANVAWIVSGVVTAGGAGLLFFTDF